MHPRLTAFEGLAKHPWLGRLYSRLTTKERDLARGFLRTNIALNSSEFEIALNRMFLSMTEKPKGYLIILELLSCANATANVVAEGEGDEGDQIPEK